MSTAEGEPTRSEEQILSEAPPGWSPDELIRHIDAVPKERVREVCAERVQAFMDEFLARMRKIDGRRVYTGLGGFRVEYSVTHVGNPELILENVLRE